MHDKFPETPPNLRYERIHPEDMRFMDAEPTWNIPDADIEESIQDLLDEGWYAEHIRAELARLGIPFQGRDRYYLGAQLVSEFVEPGRITSLISVLPEDVYQYYLHLALLQKLEYRYTTPSSLDTIFPLSLSPSVAQKQILDTGLAIQTESGELYIPEATLKGLPRSHIMFPVEVEPAEYICAQAPRNILTQIQQILGLFDQQTFKLRDRLRWSPSDHIHYSQVHCWPPHPDDARQLMSEFSKIRKITLLPPEPQLDAPSLQFWTHNLAVNADAAEFLYHLLIQSGILHAGSPVRINHILVREWLALSPGRQLAVLYNLYRVLNSWAVWWPIWRDGQINVQWDYQGYHSLVYIDAALLSTSHNLQGVMLDVLSFLPQDAWLSFNSVINWLLAVFPNSASHRYYRGLTISGFAGGWEGWLRLVLKHILVGPLHSLGLADVAPTLDQVDVFRLHHLQDIHWKWIIDLDIGKAGSIDVSALQLDIASQDMLINLPVSQDFLFMLQLWSRIEGFSGNKLHYLLDVKLLHISFERGYTPSHLIAAWTESAGCAPPPDLQAWWHQWWQHYGEIRLYPPQAILLTRDEFTMKEVQAAMPHLKTSIQSVVTPTAALIKSEMTDQVVAELERQGYMPKEVQ
jgi:hypothetical protein